MKGTDMIIKSWRYCLGLCVALMAAWGFGAVTTMPEIVSHRGESLDRPENTMAAFQLAFERGVDGVECDVYATTDGVPVIIHDATTGRTDGSGSGNGLSVTGSTWDQLKDVQVGKFGSWVNTEWATQTIPKFEDYLALLSLNTTTRCVVELKGNGANNLVANVVAAIQAQPLATKDRVVFIAFDASLIRAVRTALPDYPAWLLLSNVSDSGATIISKLQACQATGVDIHYQAASCGNPAEIATVKGAGYFFAVWTCDDTATAWTLAENGVESITTNKGKVTKDFIAQKMAEQTSFDEMVDETLPAGLSAVDVGAYAQEGLVGHFDGIRNVGADLPHDTTSRTWKNLVAVGPDAAFYYKNAVTENGYWNAKGFYFPDNVCARLTGGIALGSHPTVQLAVDINIPSQTAGKGCYKCLFHSGENSGTYNDNPSLFLDHTQGNNTDLAHTLKLKADTFADSNNSASPRPTLTLPDTFTYATFILGNDKNYLFADTDPGTGFARNVTKEYGAIPFSWGGVPYDALRMLKGTYYSVRMYNRNLTATELVWNRLLDDIRFRGLVTNGCVTVESNRAGLDGTEKSGIYFVNGSHTFTAPETATAGGNTYACTGYKLEYWNAEKKIWVFDSNSTERQFDYTRCSAISGARVTWNWKLTDGVKKYDADDYVQAGLLLNFDGIRNAGLDAGHDAAATVWKNLGSLGGVNDAALTVLNADLPGAWSEIGYNFKGGDYFALGGVVTIGHQATTQVAADFNESLVPAGPKWPHFFGHPSDRFNIYVSRNGSDSVTERGDMVNFKVDATTGFNSQNRSLLQPWDGRLINAVLDYNRSGISSTATLSWKNGTYKADVGTEAYCIGAAGGDDSAKRERLLAGRIYAVRLYDRPLTAAELQHNLEVDHARFYGTAGRSTETDLVEVRSELPEIALDGLGCYLIRGTGSKTFTAPETVTIGTRTYTCAGYRTETWNATGRTWVSPVTTSGATTCTVSGTTDAANRRITWIWTLTKGLRTAADYDVFDYVQQGLVCHYDGIRNFGASNDHITKGMFWRDLAYSANNLLAASNKCHAAWIENGYRFDTAQGSIMRMREAISLGQTCSIQSVLSVSTSAQTKDYPTYFGAPGSDNDHGMFTRGSGNTLEWKADNWCYTTRAKLANWQGLYITGIVTSDKVYLVQGTALDYSVANTKHGSIDNQRWSIGGPSREDDPAQIARRCLTGDFFAQRFYNRALTEEELAQNRKVDEIRFRDNFADYRNVVIVSEQPFEDATAAGSVPDGEYEVIGDWTFTADMLVADGKRYIPTYRLETWDGSEWVNPTTVFSDRYTHTAGATPVRLTWVWVCCRGSMITIK